MDVIHVSYPKDARAGAAPAEPDQEQGRERRQRLQGHPLLQHIRLLGQPRRPEGSRRAAVVKVTRFESKSIFYHVY